MRVKYCSSCSSWQESWAEHLKDNNYSDNKCWKCDKYELGSKVVILPVGSDFKEVIEKGGSCTKVTGNVRESFVFNKKDGSYSYDRTIGEETEENYMIVVEERQNVIVCSWPTQTVEYKRPSSPCLIS